MPFDRNSPDLAFRSPAVLGIVVGRAKETAGVPDNIEEVNPDTVRALRPFIEQWEPDWVEWVKREWPSYRPDVESTAYWAGVPLQATMAILDNLHELGELNVED